MKSFWPQIRFITCQKGQKEILEKLNLKIPIRIFRFLGEGDSTLEGLKSLLSCPNIEEKVFQKGICMEILEKTDEVWKGLKEFRKKIELQVEN